MSGEDRFGRAFSRGGASGSALIAVCVGGVDGIAVGAGRDSATAVGAGLDVEGDEGDEGVVASAILRLRAASIDRSMAWRIGRILSMVWRLS